MRNPLKDFNLHRQTGMPDWETTEEDQRNLWQQLAAATHGVVTPANIIDGLALAGEIGADSLVVAGHRQIRESAKTDAYDGLSLGIDMKLAGLFAGAPLSMADWLDGQAAERTQTKSPLGEKVDISGDFITKAVIRPWSRYAIGELSVTDFAILGGPKIINFGAAGVASLKGLELHPSLMAKIAETLRGFAFAAVDATAIAGTLAINDALKNGRMTLPEISTLLSDRKNYRKSLDEVMQEEDSRIATLYRTARQVRNATMATAAIAGYGVSGQYIANLTK